LTAAGGHATVTRRGAFLPELPPDRARPAAAAEAALVTTLADVFDGQVAASAARLAVREDGRERTYAELGADSAAVSRALAGGCAPGERVGLMIANSAAYVAAFFGIARVGGVIAPLNTRYRDQELRYYLQDTRAAFLLVTPDLVAVASAALDGLAEPPALLIVDGGRCDVVRAARRTAAPVAAGESPALLHQYTSGSTGAPKRVIRTHAHLLFELERLAAAFDLGPGDRFLGAAPFTHVNGLVRTMLTSMFVGGTLYPMPEFKRRAALDLVTRERLTFFGGVAPMIVILADTPVRGTVDLGSLRTVFSSSAPLPPDYNRRFAEKYAKWVRQLYGSTETGTISFNRDPDPSARPGSVGHPLDGVRFMVVDDVGRVVPDGVEGEVVITSPGAITGYDGNAEANAASFRAGAYCSGDLGRLDPDGALTLTGRKKFLINRGGFKVNPLEVEDAIRSHPKVREVVVLGAPSSHGDDLVRCVIVSNGACSADEIVQHCASRIADFKIPTRIEFRDALPKSETGKILRSKL
jgi:long-chain acyl-CoA synthetase